MKLDAVNFYTKSVPAAVDFYTKTIGLKLEYRQGDDYASFLFDNGVRLGIKRAVEERETPSAQTVIVVTEDAKSAYQDATSKGLVIHHPLSDDPWGVWFSVTDPDGNLLEYLQRK